jgi:EpsD family peptidyl-prolyl cis-trans isomerase
MTRLHLRRLLTLPAAVCVLAAAGCGDGNVPKESQVAVRVNDGEISAHQVRTALRLHARPTFAPGDEAASNVLEVLIDQELAAQAATAAGLHKDPDVIQALELRRREALARSYHDSVVNKVTGPSSDEIDRYYDANPALFAQRRLYLISETAVEAGADDIVSLKAAMPRVRGLVDLPLAIEQLRLESTARQYAQAAEDLPLSLLPAFAQAKPGDSIVAELAGGARIFTILHVHPAPVDRRMAAQAIARFLLTERQQSAVGSAMAELRKGAKLQYSAAFARPAAAASAPAVGAPQPVTK